MVNSYNLVNPQVKGQLKTKVKAKNSVEAAKTFYKSLSEHFNNNVPKFYFSIQKGSSGKGKYYHFEVTEKRTGEEVKFSIEPFTIKSEVKSVKKFEGRLNKFQNKYKSKGGKKKRKKKDDDSDSSDSEDYYRRDNVYVPVVDFPINYWWYDPYLYNLNSVYVPTFYSYMTPYIEYVLVP